MNASAIMFTASHNPPEYLGIKYIPDYAGPATSDITSEIVNNIGVSVTYQREGTVSTQMFFDEYVEHLSEIIDFEKIRTLDNKIIFDSLYSAATGYFDEILNLKNIKYDILHNL